MFKKILMAVGPILILCSIAVYLLVFTPEKNQTVEKPKLEKADLVVSITDEGFNPSEVSIKKGQVVEWINETQDFHWPASNLHPTHEIYSEFDPKAPLAPNESWLFKFDRRGDWDYHDHLKPNKLGRVRVE